MTDALDPQTRQSIIRKFIDWTKLKIKLHLEGEIDFYFKEREIWWAGLGKNIGFEQDGKNKKFERPILVLKKFNKEVLWILPITSKIKLDKHYFQTKYKGQTYSIILSQLRLISSKRLTRKIRVIPHSEFNKIKERIKDFLK